MSKNRWGNWSPQDHFTLLSFSSFLTSCFFVKSFFQAPVAPFALLHLFYCSFFLALLLCIHLSSSLLPLFCSIQFPPWISFLIVSLLSAHLIFFFSLYLPPFRFSIAFSNPGKAWLTCLNMLVTRLLGLETS